MSTDKKPKDTGRLSNGHFAKGNRLSPGRPKGSTCNALKTARDAAENVALPLLVTEAEKGNMEAAKALCSYGLPKLKPVSIPAGMPPDVPGILEAMAGGEVTVDDAKAALECRLLARKIVESEELEARLTELEKQVEAR